MRKKSTKAEKSYYEAKLDIDTRTIQIAEQMHSPKIISNTTETSEELVSMATKLIHKQQQIMQAQDELSKHRNASIDITNTLRHIQRTIQMPTYNITNYEVPNNRDLSDQKDQIEYLSFGYIRSEIENKYELHIPCNLKKVCLEFYGNVIMESNILDLYQTNILSNLLSQKLNGKVKYFFFRPKMICNSSNNSFDATEIELKCDKDWNNTMVIIKTNNGNVYTQFYRFKGFTDFGICLKCSFKTIPIIWTNPANNIKTYHVPNDYDLNVKEKLTDIFTKATDSNMDEIEYLTQNDIPNDIKIEHFEIFRM